MYFNTNSIRTSSLCYINNTDQGNKILQHLKDLTRNYNNKPQNVNDHIKFQLKRRGRNNNRTNIPNLNHCKDVKTIHATYFTVYIYVYKIKNNPLELNHLTWVESETLSNDLKQFISQQLNTTHINLNDTIPYIHHTIYTIPYTIYA